MRRVEVVPYQPHWRSDFEVEAAQISPILGDNLVAVHHIGSTSIPGIYAKPIIDLLVEVRDLAVVDQQNAALIALGYDGMGEFGIPERRYFRKETADGVRTHHVHIFPTGSAQVRRHLLFRDYLIAHPDEAQQYSDLKRSLAQQYPENIEGYMDGKDGFIRAIDQKAVLWRQF